MDEFLDQLPPGIVAYGVMIPFLLVLLLVYFAAIRPALANRKKRKADGASLITPTPFIATPNTPVAKTSWAASLNEDMPDLDLLLTRELSPSTPAPRPAGPRSLGEVEVALVTGEILRAREELVLLRDPADGRLIVQMPGAAYKSSASAPAAKEGFSRLMNELAKSLALPEGAVAPVSAGLSEPVAVIPAPAPPVTPPPPLPPLQRPSIPLLEPTDKNEPMPGDLPRYTNMRGAELKGRGFLGRPKFEFEHIPDLNLAASIEAYLQHRLAQTPGYAGRAWHVHPALGGGVRIQIDGQFFDSVGEISDDSARTFIQATVQEWQDRQ